MGLWDDEIVGSHGSGCMILKYRFRGHNLINSYTLRDMWPKLEYHNVKLKFSMLNHI